MLTCVWKTMLSSQKNPLTLHLKGKCTLLLMVVFRHFLHSNTEEWGGKEKLKCDGSINLAGKWSTHNYFETFLFQGTSRSGCDHNMQVKTSLLRILRERVSSRGWKEEGGTREFWTKDFRGIFIASYFTETAVFQPNFCFWVKIGLISKRQHGSRRYRTTEWVSVTRYKVKPRSFRIVSEDRHISEERNSWKVADVKMKENSVLVYMSFICRSHFESL